MSPNKIVRLTAILGIDSKKAWSQRDSVLGVVAGIATLWAVAAFFLMDSDFDRKTGLASVGVAAICWGFSRNRRGVLIGIAGIVAVQGWFAVFIANDVRTWLIAVTGTLAVFFMAYAFRDAEPPDK